MTERKGKLAAEKSNTEGEKSSAGRENCKTDGGVTGKDKTEAIVQENTDLFSDASVPDEPMSENNE